MNEINKENDFLVYELGFHLLPTVDESNLLSEFSKIKSIVEESGGVMISEDVPKMVNLAYEISKSIDSKKHKFNKAYFGWVKFEAEPVKVVEIKNKIENDQSILRFLIIKTVRENTIHTPKIPMFRKENHKEEKTEEQEEKPKMSEAELDKSIDDLVIEN